MGFDEFLDEGKSETAPAARSGTVVVETDKTTPDLLSVGGRDPRAVVGDSDNGLAILDDKSHLDGAPCVVKSVVDEVGHHSGKLELITRYHRMFDPLGAQLNPGRGTSPGAVGDHAG